MDSSPGTCPSKPAALEEGNYRMAFVANPCRPLTRTPEEALEVMLAGAVVSGEEGNAFMVHIGAPH